MKKLSIIIISSFIFAQAPPSFKLNNIDIKGNSSTSNNMVLYTAGLQKGQNVTAEDFRRAVKRLWDLGVFGDVQIEFNEEASDGISITIIVFVLSYYLIQCCAPSFLYKKNGELRQFGIGYKEKTILPAWLISIVLAILSYIIVQYCIN